MSDEDNNYTITIGDQTYTTCGQISNANTGTVTIDTNYSGPSTLTYDAGVSPTFSIGTTDTGTDWDFGSLDDLSHVSIDTDLVKSNPTCEKLWDQFIYVYEMIKADRDNENGDEDVPF